MVRIHVSPPLVILPRSQVVRHKTLTLAFRWFESSRGNHFIYVSLAQSVEHLTFNQGVWGSNPQRDTMCALVAELVDAQDLKSCECKSSCRFDSGLGHQYAEEYPSLVEGTGLENRKVG